MYRGYGPRSAERSAVAQQAGRYHRPQPNLQLQGGHYIKVEDLSKDELESMLEARSDDFDGAGKTIVLLNTFDILIHSHQSESLLLAAFLYLASV